VQLLKAEETDSAKRLGRPPGSETMQVGAKPIDAQKPYWLSGACATALSDQTARYDRKPGKR
jgi:hypothetical protein